MDPQPVSKIRFVDIVAVAVSLLAFAAILLAGCRDQWCLVFDWQKERLTATNALKANAAYKIRITQPLQNAVVQSPLVVKGDALGPWYFEASFPVRLLDADGKQIAVTPAQAQGEWMTTSSVPFKATLTFQTPSTATGFLVLEKDNPSGLPEHADSVSIPVRFR